MKNEDSHMAMSAISHAANMIQHAMQQVASAYELPSAIYRPKVYPDGNAWCALYGDNIQEGVCGFGDTPDKAIQDFNNKWYGR